jgi:hypothetical protein
VISWFQNLRLQNSQLVYRYSAVTLQAAAAAESRRMRTMVDTATTRPHLAAAMVRLAQPAVGEVVVVGGCVQAECSLPIA